MTTICVDVSGSAPVAAYVTRIVETAYPYRLVAFDNHVRWMNVIHEYADLRQFLMSVQSFGGGTDYVSLFEVLERDGNTDQCIVYSDGYGPCPTEVPSFPVYWVGDFLEVMRPPIGEILP